MTRTDKQIPLYYKYWGKARKPIEVDYCLSNGSDEEIAKRYNKSLQELKRRVAKNRWKKVKPGETYAAYHLLPYHSLDVAAVGHVLLDKIPKLKKRLAQISGMDEALFLIWIMFLLALHDLGKFLDGFQQIRKDISTLLQERESAVSSGVRHDTLGYYFWRENIMPFLQDLGILQKKRGRIAPVDIASLDVWMNAATGHHGVPHEEFEGRLSDYMNQPDDAEAAKQFIQEIIKLFMNDNIAFPEIDIDKANKASWWLAGFIVLCDWLGSSRGPADFCTEAKPLSDYWDGAIEWAEDVVAQSGLVPAKVSERFNVGDLFSKKEIDVVLTQLQKTSAECKIGIGPQLFILEDVTGSGKTEAAILLLHQLMSHGLAEGAYFALPTMATSNGMYRRMGQVYRKLFKPDSSPSCVLAHSAREMSKEFRKSIKVSADNNLFDNGDGTMPASAHCNAWLADNRKKALLAEIGVGTVDQSLLSILPSRHQSLRLLGLLGKVLVIDEVHSADRYQNVLICHLLKAHAGTGGSAILLSATLPKNQRQGFLNAFAAGLEKQAPGLKKISNKDYPLLSHFGSQGLLEQVVKTRKSVEREVTVKFLHSEQEAFQVIKEISEQGRCICWIRNTVKDTRRAYKELKPDIPEHRLDLFHARYAMQDRLDIENRVLDRFGPNSVADDRQGQVLISSPVTEQSLDLCFDSLITDLAPIDLVIQRAGRLQRHCRELEGNRINGKDRRGGAVLYIYAPLWSDAPSADWVSSTMKGTAVIHEHGRLWLTQKRLRQSNRFRMPDDARSLIEAVYGEDVMENIPEGLLDSVANDAGEKSAITSLAKSNALNLAAGYQKDGNWWDEDSTPTRHVEKEGVSVYLARWQDGHLRPWLNEEDFRWARSSVTMMKDRVSFEADHGEIPEEEIARAKETMPAKGKWGVLLPLLPAAGGLWYGYVKDKSNQLVKLFYDKKKGLMEEEEVQES